MYYQINVYATNNYNRYIFKYNLLRVKTIIYSPTDRILNKTHNSNKTQVLGICFLQSTQEQHFIKIVLACFEKLMNSCFFLMTVRINFSSQK